MTTQLRLAHMRLSPELAVGLLPSGQHCLLASAVSAQVPVSPITRLIFPVVDAQLAHMVRLLSANFFGHEVMLTGFLVNPKRAYCKLSHLSGVRVPDTNSLGIRAASAGHGAAAWGLSRMALQYEQGPALMVSSLALAPIDPSYRLQLPNLNFTQPLTGGIGCTCIYQPRLVPLYYGFHHIPTSIYTEALGPRALSFELPYRKSTAARRAVSSALALALQELESPHATLTRPTALTSNYTLEPFTNPEPLKPAYAAFLAANHLCGFARCLQLQDVADSASAVPETLLVATHA